MVLSYDFALSVKFLYDLFYKLRAGMSRVRFPKCHWNFSLMQSFWPHYDFGADSASSRNKYREYLLGDKGSRWVTLTSLPASTSSKPQDLSTPLQGMLYLYCKRYIYIYQYCEKTANPTKVLEYFPGCCVKTDENTTVRDMCSRRILKHAKNTSNTLFSWTICACVTYELETLSEQRQ
jgi:hypothetical protein